MSVWAATQKLVFDLLVADAGVHAHVADRIYDGVPEDAVWPYISFGPSDVSEVQSPECLDERTETLQIDVWASNQARLRICKEICDAVKAALHEAEDQLATGALVGMRVSGMRVMPDGDGVAAHGIIQLTILVEE